MGLADRLAGCGEVARSGCSFAWNFSHTWSLYLQRWREDTTPNMMLSVH